MSFVRRHRMKFSLNYALLQMADKAPEDDLPCVFI